MVHEPGAPGLRCPQCQGKLTIIQIEPIYDVDNAFVPYLYGCGMWILFVSDGHRVIHDFRGD